jgi:hypothetical protein
MIIVCDAITATLTMPEKNILIKLFEYIKDLLYGYLINVYNY